MKGSRLSPESPAGTPPASPASRFELIPPSRTLNFFGVMKEDEEGFQSRQYGSMDVFLLHHGLQRAGQDWLAAHEEGVWVRTGECVIMLMIIRGGGGVEEGVGHEGGAAGRGGRQRGSLEGGPGQAAGSGSHAGRQKGHGQHPWGALTGGVRGQGGAWDSIPRVLT